jgi:ABC-type nitrate/sulfonate/bicarbonate transport system substrate-binding protein
LGRLAFVLSFFVAQTNKLESFPMMNAVKISALGAVVLLSGGLLSGCASTDQLNEVRAIAERADQKASKAMEAAQDAQACCNANSEKYNKMYQKMMSK